MDSWKQSALVLSAITVGLLGASPVAEAQDFGLGTGITFGSAINGPLVGLEGTYWLDDSLAIDFYGNFGLTVPDIGDATFNLGLAAGILYAIAQGDDTKFELGARAGILANIAAANDADLFLDVLFRIEHWFDNHFAINGQVGITFMGDPDANGADGFAMRFGAQAGLGMMYYFDGNARPGDGGAPEPEPAPARYEPPPPAPAPAPAEPPPAADPEGSAGW